MNEVVKTGLELTFVFLSILLFLYIRYRFPHFSIHFFNGISKFGFNSFDYESKCKKHTKEDVEKFKKQQRFLIILMLILFASTMIFYISSHLLVGR